MTEILAALFLVVGSSFMLIASIGVIRMPDLPTRMHSTTKAPTLGAGLVLLAVALHFGELGISARCLVGIFFVVLTAPVAAHLIARASYRSGIRLWEGTLVDQLREKSGK